MDYKIIDFNATTAQISVAFLLIEGFVISIDLPLDEHGNVPVGNELDTFIKGFLPYGALQRQQALANGIRNAAAIEALVQRDGAVTTDNLAGLGN